MRNIERSFGRMKGVSGSCCCDDESRFPKPSENARLWCGLLAEDSQGYVRQTSKCQMFETGWLVWQPDSVGFSWAEVIEIPNISHLFQSSYENSKANLRSLQEWESLGRNEFKFRIFPKSERTESELTNELRCSLMTDILKRNQSFSHVNLMLPQTESALTGFHESQKILENGLVIERLRDRIVPSWQSGDMVIQTFTTYTLSRKDTP